MNPQHNISLRDSLTRSLTGSLTSVMIKDYGCSLNHNAWLLLKEFATAKTPDGRDLALSVNDLERFYMGNMHMNTIRNNVKKLLYKSFIKLHRDDSGRTKTEKLYLVTTDGKIAWKRYFENVLMVL